MILGLGSILDWVKLGFINGLSYRYLSLPRAPYLDDGVDE